MAALTKVDKKAGQIPLMEGYRIHDDQIKSVARYFHELYQMRRPGLRPSGGIDTTPGQKNGTSAGTTIPRTGKTIWVTGTVNDTETTGLPEQSPESKVARPRMMAVRCSRCGVNFPMADFLYTQKSGLCIDCWEDLVI